MRKSFVLLLAALAFAGCCRYEVGSPAYAEHFRAIVSELSSEKYQGRGYANDGVLIAGGYIEEEFRKAGANEVIEQSFAIDINTFPGKMEASVDGRELVPGRDFVMREYSPGVKGEYRLYYIDTLHYDSAKLFRDLERPFNKDVFVVCDFWFTYKHSADFKKLQDGSCTNAGILYTWDTPLKFYKAYGEKVVERPIIWTTADAIRGAKTITLDIESKFFEKYVSNNLIARIDGHRHDSCYVFTAHYDHLGNLGVDVYYPGANDNASGTAAIITLAEYYAHNKPKFDIYCIAFSGEDANLRGSTYFVEHPVVPLEQIKYLVNLDMIGDNNPVQYCEVSDAGMAAFQLWESINAACGSFQSLRRGDLGANSDHYPFAVRGVPCILFENEEGDAFKFYHTAEDNVETMQFGSFEPIFKLVTSFVDAN